MSADGRSEPRVWRELSRSVGELDVTRNGRRIAYIARGGLVISNRRATVVRPVRIEHSEHRGSFAPQFRGDGRRIVWHQALIPRGAATCVATVRARPVTCFQARRDALVAWGPAGSFLHAPLHEVSAGVCELDIDPDDGTTECGREVVPGEERWPITGQPELSRDGRRLLVTQGGGSRSRIAVYDVRRARLVRVLATVDAEARNASWSPDERHVVFDRTESPESVTRSVWIVSARGGRPRHLVGDGAFDPHWSR